MKPNVDVSYQLPITLPPLIFRMHLLRFNHNEKQREIYLAK